MDEYGDYGEVFPLDIELDVRDASDYRDSVLAGLLQSGDLFGGSPY